MGQQRVESEREVIRRETGMQQEEAASSWKRGKGLQRGGRREHHLGGEWELQGVPVVP